MTANQTRAELVLTGGQVIDPANGIDGVANVAVAGGKVLAVGAGLAPGDATVLDVSGHYVTPGIVDLHAHVAYTKRAHRMDALLSLDPRVHTFSSGVTTVVDAGTCGWRDFPAFRREVMSGPC